MQFYRMNVRCRRRVGRGELCGANHQILMKFYRMNVRFRRRAG